jgi:uncharacterized membrane protein
MTESQQVRGRHAGPSAQGGNPPQGQDDGRAEVQSGHHDQGEAEGREAAQAAAQHDAHGQSLASWTCVSVIMVGSLVMAVAVVVESIWLFVVGGVIVVAGAISGKVLSAMGFGVSGRPGH